MPSAFSDMSQREQPRRASHADSGGRVNNLKRSAVAPDRGNAVYRPPSEALSKASGPPVREHAVRWSRKLTYPGLRAARDGARPRQSIVQRPETLDRIPHRASDEARASTPSPQEGPRTVERGGERRAAAAAGGSRDDERRTSPSLFAAAPVSLDRLEASVLSNVLYEDDKIVAFNKSAGIRLYRKELMTPDGDDKVAMVRSTRDPVVEDVLPKLAEQLGCKRLFISTGIDKECSGVVVLAKQPDVNARLQRYLLNIMTQKLFAQTFSALTLGIPAKEEGEHLLQLLTNSKINDSIVTKVVKQASNKMVLRGEAMRTPIRHRVLSSDSQLNVALVEVQAVRAKWHSIELYLTNILRCRILGELTYSAQVKSMMGHSFVVPHQPDLADEGIPADVAAALGLPDAARKTAIPVHLHRSELQLPALHCAASRRPTLAMVVKAPLPRYFHDALKLLRLAAR